MPKKTKKGRGVSGDGKMNEEASGIQSKDETAVKNVHSRRTLSLKAELETEKRNSAANMLKVNEGWRSILRQTQDPELRQQIMMLKQQFECQIDGLDGDIKNLECGLLRRERQSAQVHRAHLQSVESLCALQNKRINLVQQPWENCMQHISSKLISQREMLLPDSQQKEDQLEATMSLMEDEHKAVLEDMHELYLRSAALYEDAYEERKEAAAKKKEKSKEEPKEKSKKDKFIPMMWRNTVDIKKANVDMKKVMRVKRSQEQTLKKLFAHHEDVRAQQEQERLRLHNQLAQAQKDGRKRINNLTVQSNNAAKKLQTVIAQGERLLHVGEVCQKLESKLEKASAISFSTTEHQEEKTGPETEEPAKKVSEFPELRQLAQRLTDVALQRETLKKHKVELLQENEQLKLQLCEHLDDMTLSNNTFNRPNAPLTVQRILTTRAPNTSDTPNTKAPTTNTPTTNTPTTT